MKTYQIVKRDYFKAERSMHMTIARAVKLLEVQLNKIEDAGGIVKRKDSYRAICELDGTVIQFEIVAVELT